MIANALKKKLEADVETAKVDLEMFLTKTTGVADHIDFVASAEKKLEALAKYDFELRQWPHPRSIQAVEHLARWRGSTVGVEAAEAFMLGRKIL